MFWLLLLLTNCLKCRKLFFFKTDNVWCTLWRSKGLFFGLQIF
jgi:hypothetical protein